MTKILYECNTSSAFWHCLTDPERKKWRVAIENASPILALSQPYNNIEELTENVLGEGQFGPDHWRLSLPKRVYYSIKPLIPRAATRLLRRIYKAPVHAKGSLDWPIEQRYVKFQWQVMEHLLHSLDPPSLPFIHFWPGGHRYAFVLTHDIETAKGQDFVREVMELEEEYGFRSLFNFVPERYTVDRDLMVELRARGFEVGVHGLNHDGKLFNSRAGFARRAARINHYLREFAAVGFRAPLTIRNPEWMQDLDIEYDLSFFDTDPYEPIPGGTMSIWPFFIGHFVELPYTLAQDYTLNMVLKQKTAAPWLQKVDFIERNYGMALVNSHPDYLLKPTSWAVYEQFLGAMRDRAGYWHALPREVASWWRARAQAQSIEELDRAVVSEATLIGGELHIQVSQKSLPIIASV
jgi:hypothetical protein